jgi:DNA-binding MarR family transcriptional regulator
VAEDETMSKPLITALMRGVYWFDDALEDALAAHGIVSLSRAEAFVILNMSIGETRAANIARNIGVSRQAISQILGALEARGYVTMKPDPTDERARVASFSAMFEKHAPLCEKIFRASEKELENRIGASKVAGLRKALMADWGPSPRLSDTTMTGSRRAVARPRKRKNR